MSQVENLIPLNKRTKAEQREICKKGGMATAETYRRRKSLREIFNALGAAEISDEDLKKRIKTEFPELREITNDVVVGHSVLRKAKEGDIAAATFYRDTKGEKPKDQIEAEFPTKDRPRIEIIEESLDE